MNGENEIASKYEVSWKEWKQNRAEGRGDYHLECVRWLLLPAGKDFQQMRAHDFYYIEIKAVEFFSRESCNCNT